MTPPRRARLDLVEAVFATVTGEHPELPAGRVLRAVVRSLSELEAVAREPLPLQSRHAQEVLTSMARARLALTLPDPAVGASL